MKGTALRPNANVLLLTAFCLFGGAAAMIPTPCIQIGKPVYTNASGTAAWAVDGSYTSGALSDSNPTVAAPMWIAIKVGTGPTRLFLDWSDHRQAWYWTIQEGVEPADYQIEVSSNSTIGSDGTWTPVVTVTGNHFHGRGHSFDFTGKSWVKINITKKIVGTQVTDSVLHIDEITLHDASAGLDDSWFFIGNSITCMSFTPKDVSPNFFGNLIHQAYPAFFPVQLDGGTPMYTSANILSHIDSILLVNPDYKYFCTEIGTNDAGTGVDTATFRSNVDQIITKIRAAGRVPILAQIPWADSGVASAEYFPSYNAVLRSLTAKYNLPAGPDLYTYFFNHQDQMQTANVHPNQTGWGSINQQWAQTVIADGLYAPTGVTLKPFEGAKASPSLTNDNNRAGTYGAMLDLAGRRIPLRPSNGIIIENNRLRPVVGR